MSGSHSKHIAEVTLGAVQELARQGGKSIGHPHGVAKAGEALVKGAAVVAPGAVAAASVGTAAVVSTAVAVAPVAAVAAAGYGVYKLGKWLWNN
jgi:hypothetical protein